MKWLKDTALGVVVAFATTFLSLLISSNFSGEIANVSVYEKAAAGGVGAAAIVLLNALSALQAKLKPA